VQPPLVGGGANQSVLFMSVNSQSEQLSLPASSLHRQSVIIDNAQIISNTNRRLGHPGGKRGAEVVGNEGGSEQTVKLHELNGVLGVKPGQVSIQSSMISSQGIHQLNFNAGSAAMPSGGLARQTVIYDLFQ